jgi:hypothetical protein
MSYPQYLTDLIKYDPKPDGSQASYLELYVKFYQRLSDQGKRKFLRRTKRFITNKDFEFFLDSQQDHVLIKTLIAASCIQLTWGLDDIYLDSYSYIGVYRNGIQLKKEKTKSLNALFLRSGKNESWDEVKKGHFFMGGGGRQIGLMEWTCVFIIEAKKDNILDDFFSAYYKVWCEAARDIMFVVDEEEQIPLDTFGKRLPVIIQHFFEEPAELQQNHPEIYEHTKILLNLDLLEGAEYDFIYSDKVKKEKKISSSNRALIFDVQDQVRKFGLPAGIMYYILFQMPFVIAIWYIMGRWAYFSLTFWGIFLAFATVGIFLVYWFYYIKRGLARLPSVILFFLGVIPFIYGGMHLLNYTIPLKHESHRVYVEKLSDLENDLPWRGFTHLHVSKVLETKMKVTTRVPHKAAYALDLKKGLVPNMENEKTTIVNEVVKIHTGLNHVRGMSSLFDHKKDIIEMHTYTGLFGATVFHGYVLILME